MSYIFSDHAVVYNDTGKCIWLRVYKRSGGGFEGFTLQNKNVNTINFTSGDMHGLYWNEGEPEEWVPIFREAFDVANGATITIVADAVSGNPLLKYQPPSSFPVPIIPLPPVERRTNRSKSAVDGGGGGGGGGKDINSTTGGDDLFSSYPPSVLSPALSDEGTSLLLLYFIFVIISLFL